ncbi:MAG: hypothetical protein JNM41_02045 [Flavipsychrobacter sp.]|nr:hypothetical protein [Flavipsychrobacter sp.]
MSVIFRAFRAIDDEESCQKFIVGHRMVLEMYGIGMITSATAQWTQHKNTYVILAEASDDGRALGGVRVQIADEELPLPIVKAVGQVDEKIHEVINMHRGKRIAEACGLWNAKEIAGYGYSFFILRSAIALAYHLKVDSLFALAAPVTVNMCLNAGFSIETYLGNNGFFNYPKLDLVATAMVINDLGVMSNSTEVDRAHIFEIMKNPDHVAVVTGPKGDVTIDYRLSIK